MSAARRVPVPLACIVIALLAWFVPSASAQDAPSEAELQARIARVRALSPEDKGRLREALRRFRELPPERRAELREKARRVGSDRLCALTGGDLDALRERHARMRMELEQIRGLLSFDERAQDLEPRERAYLEHEIVRGFHRSVNRRLLSPDDSPVDVKEWEQLPRDERRRRFEERIESALPTLMTPEELAAYRAAQGEERARLRRTALFEFRDRQIDAFARDFDATVFTRFLQTPPATRREFVEAFERRGRFHEMPLRLQRELGVPGEVLAMLRRLPRSDWPRIRDRYAELREQPVPARRIEIEKLVRELHAKASRDGSLRPESPRQPEGRHGSRPPRRWRPRGSGEFDAPR